MNYKKDLDYNILKCPYCPRKFISSWSIKNHIKLLKEIRPHTENRLKEMIHILKYRMNSDMNERDLDKLSKAELINLVEKLQNKARKPKIAIADDDNGQVPQP